MIKRIVLFFRSSNKISPLKSPTHVRIIFQNKLTEGKFKISMLLNIINIPVYLLKWKPFSDKRINGSLNIELLFVLAENVCVCTSDKEKLIIVDKSLRNNHLSSVCYKCIMDRKVKNIFIIEKNCYFVIKKNYYFYCIRKVDFIETKRNIFLSQFYSAEKTYKFKSVFLKTSVSNHVVSSKVISGKGEKLYLKNNQHINQPLNA
ncbi:hypothetical protein KUTeg_022385 [Tegillarca granosa]|uniref:Uncharacterized protein n=1 Tax=Tegillarca granosa TaxID=220873 RepID=A0ABQ9EAN5_TEGGR|nr:hypothetical protein KUTeg_022385 [Tegillarca granosa]